jgi:hypothetical protein
VSVANGYVELDITTGAIKKEVLTFDSVESLRRLPSGHTILGGNSNGGVTLQELDSQDAPVPGNNMTFTSYSQFRLLRRTPQGTFLIGVANTLAEVGWGKKTIWIRTTSIKGCACRTTPSRSPQAMGPRFCSSTPRPRKC